MKVATRKKTSITLSAELLAQLDAVTEPSMSRSAFIEHVIRRFLEDRRQAAADARDLRTINRHAEQLNAEATDVREYQAPWPDE